MANSISIDVEKWRSTVTRRILRVEIVVTIIFTILIFNFTNVTTIHPSIDELSELKTALRKAENEISSLLYFKSSQQKLNYEARHNIQNFHNFQNKQTIEQNEGFVPFTHTTPKSAIKFNQVNKEIETRSHYPIPHVLKQKDNYSRTLRKLGVTLESIPLCAQKPTLSPYHNLNNHSYDIRIDKILNVIYKLSPSVSLSDHNSPQYKAACFLIYDDTMQMHPHESLLPERYIVAKLLYDSHIHVEREFYHTCEYMGIICDDNTGHIIEIDWSQNNYLGGIIPSEIFYIQHLKILDLSRNSLKGKIPSEIGLLSNLEKLVLNDNLLTGTVPTEIGTLFNLRTLDLESNDLHGNIPSEIGLLKNLENLTFHMNALTGTIPIQIGEIKTLREISLHENSLTGKIPHTIGQCHALEHIDLGNNKLYGTIPTELSNCTRLETYKINKNNLNGTIPQETALLSELLELNLASNKLTGTIPSEISSITLLKELRLSSNRLNGTFPEAFNNLPNMYILSIANNFLTGFLPDVFENMQQISFIDVSNNALYGPIPKSIWGHSLQALNILNTNLSGYVPRDLCDNILRENFLADDSRWFNIPKVINHCSTRPAESFLMDISEPSLCPDSNVFPTRNDYYYDVKDHVGQVLFTQKSSAKNYLCLSPTGCYKIERYSPFKASTREEVIRQSSCNTMKICGRILPLGVKKRTILNHLTQLAFPDLNDTPLRSPKYRALCSIVGDSGYNETGIFDGTILQRFVLTYFYNIIAPTLVNNGNVCGWEGITCDVFKTYVERIELPNRDLTGNLITEIGLLQKLRVIDLSGNNLDGFLYDTFFDGLQKLEVFNISGNRFEGSISYIRFDSLTNLEMLNLSNNRFGGSIPRTLLSLEYLCQLDLSNNFFDGTLPQFIKYSRSLENFHVGHNLLQGSIPDTLTECKMIEYIDISHNAFTGTIPYNLGYLENLKLMHLEANNLEGHIPNNIFFPLGIQEIWLQNNQLSGTIPTDTFRLKNATRLLFNHNSLEGTIPSSFSNLTNIQMIHFHHNKLTGTAPKIVFEDKNERSYITDCGDPSFLPSGPVLCKGCSMCCNSLDECQPQRFTNWLRPLVYAVGGVLLLSLIAGLLVSSNREIEHWYPAGSVYCLIFSKNIVAWCLFILTIVVQFYLFFIYFFAVRSQPIDSDWQYSYQCTENNLECIDMNDTNKRGWILHSIFIIIYLGRSLVLSMVQVSIGIKSKDMSFCVNGLLLGLLVSWAFIVSFVYNHGTGLSNRDLITNAVIFAYINTIDGAVFNLLKTLNPKWVDERVEEVENYITKALGVKDAPSVASETDIDTRNNSPSDDSEMPIVFDDYELTRIGETNNDAVISSDSDPNRNSEISTYESQSTNTPQPVEPFLYTKLMNPPTGYTEIPHDVSDTDESIIPTYNLQRKSNLTLDTETPFDTAAIAESAKPGSSQPTKSYLYSRLKNPSVSEDPEDLFNPDIFSEPQIQTHHVQSASPSQPAKSYLYSRLKNPSVSEDLSNPDIFSEPEIQTHNVQSASPSQPAKSYLYSRLTNPSVNEDLSNPDFFKEPEIQTDNLQPADSSQPAESNAHNS